MVFAFVKCGKSKTDLKYMNIITSIIITIVISFITIFIGHQLLDYVRDNYSTKKTNYLVGSQIEKYKSMIQEIQENKESTQITTYSPPISQNDMKADLETFLQEIQN